MAGIIDTRTYPERPIVGIGVVVWRDQSVLLVRRGKPPNLGQWSLPGGAQHLGETVYAGGRREVMEETGLAVQVTGIVDVVDGIQRDAQGAVRYHYTLIDLAAESPDGEAVAADDAAALAWFRLDELPALGLWSETERIIMLAAQLRKES